MRSKEKVANPKEDVFGADMDEILGIGKRRKKVQSIAFIFF
jgi:hypothetical protein